MFQEARQKLISNPSASGPSPQGGHSWLHLMDPNPKDRFKIFLNTVPKDQQPICRFHVVLSCCIMFCGSKFPMVFLHYDKCPTCTVATTQQDPTPNLQPLPERWKTFFDSRMSPVPLVRWTAGNFNGSNRLSWRSIYLWLMTFYKV